MNARIYRLFLADRPYAGEPEARTSMSCTLPAARFGSVEEAIRVAPTLAAEYQKLYDHPYTHWWLLGQSGAPGDLASLRRWFIAEGVMPAAADTPVVV